MTTAQLLPWLPTAKRSIKPDLVAGLSVAIIAIPQGLAYATLAGLPPYIGLYASLIPTITAALFGTSNFLVTGPVAMVSLLTLSSLSGHAQPLSGEYVALAATLALLVGAIQLVMSFFKLGGLIKFISHPVLMGFTNAAAIIIALTQLPKLFGLTPIAHGHPGLNAVEVLTHPGAILTTSFFFGFLPLAAMLLTKKYKPSFPIALIVTAYAIFLSTIAGYMGPVVGHIPAGLPTPSLPPLNFSILKLLSFSAFIIAIISYMEGISIAKSLAAKANQSIRTNRELMAQGIANLTGSLTMSYPVAGSFSRTALNHSSGAKTPLSAIIAGLTVLLVLLFFTPLFQNLPQATLAAIIIAAIVSLISPKKFVKLVKARKREGIVAITTFVCTFAFAPHLDYGILAGIIVSVIMHMHRTAHPHIQLFFLKEGDHHGEVHFKHYPSNHKVLAVAVDWNLNFANASYLEEVILSACDSHREVKYVLILSRSISYIDHSAEEVLKHLTNRLNSRGIDILFSGMQPDVKAKLKHTEFFDFTDPHHIFDRASKALKTIDQIEKKS